MKLDGKFGIGNILKVFLEICMVVLITNLLLLFQIVNFLKLKFDLFIVMIYPCGICFLALIYQFIKLFDSLKNNKPFSNDTIKRFNNSQIICFIISLLVFIALFLLIFVYDYYSNELRYCIAFIGILFFGVGVALYIMKSLFKEAISYKELNDLTI